MLPAISHSVSHPIGHATAEIGATGTVGSQSAEQDPAQHKDSKRLPESNQAPAEQRRQKPIPQVHYDLAADVNKNQNS